MHPTGTKLQFREGANISYLYGMLKIRHTIWLLTAFSIAMGYMEGAVVVYLREIFYPGGFEFPLQPITAHIALTEVLREAATLVMLITIAWLTGRTRTERFGFFIFCFAIWDITYYAALCLLLGWPASLLTWDILFLIPVTWVGPVLGPVLNSLSMILLALLISHFTSKELNTRIIPMEWALLILGSLVVIVSYTEDYVSFMLRRFGFFGVLFPSDTETLMEHAMGYVPVSFAWWVFWIGQGLILLGIGLFSRRNGRAKDIRTRNTDLGSQFQ